MVTKYDVDPEKAFENALARASKALDDLRIPLRLISLDFFKSNQAIWKLKSPGQYDDITDQTKKRKKRKLGFEYPILKATGRLEKSMSSTDGKPGRGSISRITNKKDMEIGTRVPYGGFHQFGTKFMPARPFLFIGPEAPRFAIASTSGRPGRWLNILNDFTLKSSQKEFEL